MEKTKKINHNGLHKVLKNWFAVFVVIIIKIQDTEAAIKGVL